MKGGNFVSKLDLLRQMRTGIAKDIQRSGFDRITMQEARRAEKFIARTIGEVWDEARAAVRLPPKVIVRKMKRRKAKMNKRAQFVEPGAIDAKPVHRIQMIRTGGVMHITDIPAPIQPRPAPPRRIVVEQHGQCKITRMVAWDDL